MRYQPGLRIPLRRSRAAAPPVRPCPNCGVPVDDRFCPRCGQANRERLVSFRAIVRDAAEDQLSLGGALPRTLGALLFWPGLLTRDYAEGRIARYVAPFRLYLLASLVFFVAASTVVGFDSVWKQTEPFVGRATAGNYALVRIGLDTARVPGWLRPPARYYVHKEEALNRMPPREGARVLYDSMSRSVPRALFLMVPLFALLLKGLYRKRLYVELFVFVLHFHSLAFLLATLAVVGREEWLTALVAAWLLVYLLLAMRRVYGQGWPTTAAKYAALLVGYYAVFILLLGGVVVAAVVAT